ncbi:MAG: hypothetical protein KKH94_10715 [Candidatus Omnitrophica bacterium]|nr:hypothetical protein [Candidatus Omnitrophota bacterium]
MLKTAVVKCKQCQNEWVIDELFMREFEKRVTLQCPKCKETYKDVMVHTMLVGDYAEKKETDLSPKKNIAAAKNIVSVLKEVGEPLIAITKKLYHEGGMWSPLILAFVLFLIFWGILIVLPIISWWLSGLLLLLVSAIGILSFLAGKKTHDERE